MNFILIILFLIPNAYSAGVIEIWGDEYSVLSPTKKQVTVTGDRELVVYSDIGSTVSNPNYTAITDGVNNSVAYVSPIQELKVMESSRLVGTTFNNGFFDYNFWSTGTVNGATIEIIEGKAVLKTSTTADSTSHIHSLRAARFVLSNANEFCSVVRFTTSMPSTGTNERYWGLADIYDTEEIFFKYKNGAFYVGIKRAGVETLISTNSFNGIVPSMDENYHIYSIVYTAMLIRFYKDNVLLHTITTTDTSHVSTLDFQTSAHNYNSDGEDGIHYLYVKALVISRLGEIITMPKKKHINAAGTYILKLGPGVLHSIITNELGAVNTSIEVYDSTSAVNGGLFADIDTYKTTIATLNYKAPFDKGLTIVGTGLFGNITVIYE